MRERATKRKLPFTVGANGEQKDSDTGNPPSPGRGTTGQGTGCTVPVSPQTPEPESAVNSKGSARSGQSSWTWSGQFQHCPLTSAGFTLWALCDSWVGCRTFGYSRGTGPAPWTLLLDMLGHRKVVEAVGGLWAGCGET